jgi:tRNA pseudouridine38-40 synthase
LRKLTPPKITSNWRLIVAYQGSLFHGWQVQRNLRTVEQTLKECLEKLTKQAITLQAAGRTDAGVHAKGQVVSFLMNSRFDRRGLILALNNILPSDVAVLDASIVDNNFSARFSSVGKKYAYRIYQNLARNPFKLQNAWHFEAKLDLDKMKQAALFLIGEHDFESFRSSQCSAAHARRHIWLITFEQQDDLLQIDIRGNAFCHNMVRIIVGNLLAVGLGKSLPENIKNILDAKDRTKGFSTVPACGLSLEEVYYLDNLHLAKIPKQAEGALLNLALRRIKLRSID